MSRNESVVTGRWLSIKRFVKPSDAKNNIGANMKRTEINLIVDLLAAGSLLGMIATGLILRFPLPPGTNKSHELWGISRHGWGTLHFWLSATLLIILLVHIMLHWHWIVCVIGKRFGKTVSEVDSSKIGFFAAILVACALGLFLWLTYANVVPFNDSNDVSHSTPTTSQQQVSERSQKADAGKGTASQLFFKKDIAPLLERACLNCHGPSRAAGDFRVDRQQDWFAISNRGAFVVPGNSSESSIMEIVSGRRSDLPHPNRHVLPQDETAILKSWIDSGALWQE
jgi:hypothetical protein